LESEVLARGEHAADDKGMAHVAGDRATPITILRMVGSSSLIGHIKRGDVIALRTALADGANVSEEDSQGWTPLFHAAAKGNLAILRALIDAGADVNHGVQTGFTALYAAVLGGHLEIAKELLKTGARAVPIQGRALSAYSTSAEMSTLLASQIDFNT
jgi:hypothetical protein